MKSKFKILLSFLFVALFVTGVGVLSACGGKSEPDITDGTKGLYYWENDDGQSYRVGMGEKVSTKDIVIPTTYKGKPVTEIAPGAFDGTDIVSITFTDNVTKIDYSAFQNCQSLTKINWGKNISSIGSNAFENCNALQEVEAPESVVEFGYSVFSECSSLTKVIIHGNATLDNHVFSQCSSLETVEFLGENSLTLGSSIFTHSPNLKQMKFTAQNVTADEWAFMDCEPTTLSATTNFLNSCFIGTDQLQISKNSIENLEIFDGETLPEGFSALFTKLKTLTLPKTFKTSTNRAFDSAYSLERVNYLGTLADWCNIDFDGYRSHPFCRSSKNKVELYIDGNLVEGDLTITSGISEVKPYAFYGYDKINTLTLAEGVETVGSYAFNSCGLLKITLPESLTSINQYAFYGNQGLVSIVNHSALSEQSIQNTTDGSNYLEIKTEDDGGCLQMLNDLVFFKFADGSYALAKYLGTATEITLPASIDNEDYIILANTFSGASLESIIFAEQSNWYAQENNNEAVEMDVTDPNTNATNLKSTHANKNWYRILP